VVAKNVWVIAEQREGKVLNISFELLSIGRQLADTLGGTLSAVVLGYKMRQESEELIYHGADRVYLADSPRLALYQQKLYTHVISSLAKEHKPEIILMGCTVLGQELAPAVAARLDTGLSSHCVNLRISEEGYLEQIIPAYGGVGVITCPVSRPQMATIGPGVFNKPKRNPEKSGQIINIDLLDLPKKIGAETKSIVHEEPEEVPIEEASVVVAGGAGAATPEGWQMIKDLAKALNGAVGATRPPVDEGFAQDEQMIGQSGKTIQPDLYIGVGVSGEVQHTVGIERAKVVVAINNDPRAPIFEQADYGIVADFKEVLPLLITELKARKSS